MPRYAYKVVPAPKKVGKIKGLKGTDVLFATALAEVMNQMGAEGWEYQRTDTLPCEERSGLTGKVTTFQNMLIFRRKLDDDAGAAEAPARITESEPMLAIPTFRATAAGLAPVGRAAEADRPQLGAARHPEPNDQARAPDIAAQ